LGYPEFDLLGDPIPRNHGERGRPEHAFDPKIAKTIRVLLCADMTLGRIAREVGLSAPTLRKVYFQSGKISRAQARKVALAEQKAKMLLRLDAAADSGNVSAMKAQINMLEREIFAIRDAEELARRSGKQTEPMGVKERRRKTAAEAESELEGWLEDEIGDTEQSGSRLQ
jgi:predicted transcriptional regulator